MFKINPYRPGAGLMPTYLAGRDEDINNIEQIQYMKQAELGALIAALHRTNQLAYPIMVVGAGLPKIHKILSDEKSYSERLFYYKEIDSLTDEQAGKAVREPAKKVNVCYTDEANKGIIYPVRHSELDFTVPEFNEFIKRLDKYQQWCHEHSD